jgi:putative ABC transport system ATP-binding protein
MELLRAEKLVKEYRIGENITRAIDGISLIINSGEFVAIEGKSGSGKSTLLYQLSLLDHPTFGEVFLKRKTTKDYTSDERGMARLNVFGYVFQDYALVPELTAIENVLLPLFMQGCTLKNCRRVAEEKLIQVGLENRLNNRPSQLSGGEQQRVSIARALVNGPEVLFADEPTANLDTETSKKVLDILIDLNKKGLTVVMVTHEKDYATVAGRRVKLRDGKIERDIL